MISKSVMDAYTEKPEEKEPIFRDPPKTMISLREALLVAAVVILGVMLFMQLTTTPAAQEHREREAASEAAYFAGFDTISKACDPTSQISECIFLCNASYDDAEYRSSCIRGLALSPEIKYAALIR